jgi:hypothetical protein
MTGKIGKMFAIHAAFLLLLLLLPAFGALSPSRGDYRVAPGETASFTIFVDNYEKTPTSFSIEIGGDAAPFTSASTLLFTVSAMGYSEVPITISPPKSQKTGNYSLTLSVAGGATGSGGGATGAGFKKVIVGSYTIVVKGAEKASPTTTGSQSSGNPQPVFSLSGPAELILPAGGILVIIIFIVVFAGLARGRGGPPPSINSAWRPPKFGP